MTKAGKVMIKIIEKLENGGFLYPVAAHAYFRDIEKVSRSIR